MATWKLCGLALLDVPILCCKGTSLSKTHLEAHAKNLNTHRERLEKEEERKDKNMEAMRQSEREVADLMVRMKNLDLSKVKIDDVFSFLQEILTYLSSNQEQWTHLTEFFENLNFFVSKDLNKCIQDFTEGVKDGDAVETLVKPALIVSGLCVQMCNCASIYLEVSKKFIMPAITTVPGNLSLSKEQVEKKKKDFDSQNERIHESVRQLIDTKYKALMNEFEDNLKEQQTELLRAINQ